MSGYTKGPWEFHEDDGEDNQIVVGDNGDVICVVGSYMTSVEEDFANGPLIAAAPELLEALQETVKDLVAYQVNALHAAKSNNRWEGCAEAVQPSIDAAHAAIAKALGNH